MDPNVFLENQTYVIKVEDARIDSDGRVKGDEEVYSKVTSIIEVQRDGTSKSGAVSIDAR